MDIKTRLENEELFGYQPNVGKKRIISLNKKGIYTVEDFINSDVSDIATALYLKKYYIALQHVLKYKYKGEPLVLDVLLDKIYKISREKCDFESQRELNIDAAIKLGFERYKVSIIARKILKSKMLENNDYYPHIRKDIGPKKPFYEVSILEILQILAQTGDKLAQFYIAYYEEKKIENKKYTDLESLEKLKEEIVLLTAQREGLDEKILVLTKQLEDLERDSIANER